MADKKEWKVYRNGKMVAATAHPEDAAAIVGMGGEATVKFRGRIVFRGPVDEESGVDAADSWDAAAGVMSDRAWKHHRARLERLTGADR